MKDVVSPEDHRSIRSISLPPNRKKGDAASPEQRQHSQEGIISQRRQKRRAPSSWFVWIAAIVVVAVLIAVIASVIFKKATVIVTPKIQEVVLPEIIISYTDAPLEKLQFQTITTTNVGNRTVPASGESQVEKRSSGTITIYNEYSTASQRLIKNTRFEAPDGKIYRIDQSIVVPGAKRKSDGTLTPGTLEVVVHADSAGEAYNRGIDTYTIPGFKGDPRYSKFYAKGKEPMQGGFVGTQKIVAEADLSAAKTAIQTELTSSLNEALISATPAGYILVPQSAAVAYEELPQGGDTGAAVISLRGTAQAAIVREADLASSIARKVAVEGYDGEALRFADVSKLVLEAKATVGAGIKSVPIAFSGNTTLVWQIDAEAIQKALVGQDTDNLLAILTSFKPSVADARSSLRPFWQSTFPDDAAKIEVEVNDPL